MTDDEFDSTWIHEFSESHEVGRLDADTVDALLDLAGRAAHDTGDRRNAPLACFVAGLYLGAEKIAPNADAVNAV